MFCCVGFRNGSRVGLTLAANGHGMSCICGFAVNIQRICTGTYIFTVVKDKHMRSFPRTCSYIGPKRFRPGGFF
jgi:hypothetical protein